MIVLYCTRIEFEEWEHVTCLKNVSLSYEGARSGMKGYLALGTNFNYGEDVTSRGQVSIYMIWIYVCLYTFEFG